MNASLQHSITSCFFSFDHTIFILHGSSNTGENCNSKDEDGVHTTSKRHKKTTEQSSTSDRKDNIDDDDDGTDPTNDPFDNCEFKLGARGDGASANDESVQNLFLNLAQHTSKPRAVPRPHSSPSNTHKNNLQGKSGSRLARSRTFSTCSGYTNIKFGAGYSIRLKLFQSAADTCKLRIRQVRLPPAAFFLMLH